MLVLSRRRDSTIQIGADIEIIVLDIHKGQVKLGIRAPNEVSVLRGELMPPAGGSASHAVTTARPSVTATRTP